MIRVLGTTNRAHFIALKVAGFPPHTNLARLQAVRTKFMDLTQLAYLKRTSFGLVTNRMQSIVASSRWDAALEAFRHNPADGSFAPPADRPSA